MASNGKKHGVLRTYKSYNFVDKDPVIDALRTVKSDSGMGNTEIEENGGPKAGTLSNWFNGKVRRPQWCTIAAAAIAMGKRGVRFDRGRVKFED